MTSIPALQKLVVLEPLILRYLNGDCDAAELASRIRQVIEDQSQHLPSQIAFSSLMSKFVEAGLALLNFSDPKELIKYKIAGLTIFDCLLDVNDEIMPERRIELASHISKVLENDKLPLSVNEVILKLACVSIGHFARVASTTEVEFLQNFYYPLALKLIVDSRSDGHRYAGALVLTQLANFSPALIFSKRKVLFNVIWDAVCDKNKIVRSAAAATLEASLQVISQREAMSDYIRSALKQIDLGFNAAIAEKILGSLIILDTLMSGTVVSFIEMNNTMRQQGVAVQDIIWKVLQRKDWRDQEVRLKIIELIPNMASAFSNTFLQPNNYTSPHNFLTFCLKHFTDTIGGRRERHSAYLALARLFVAMANYFRSTPNVSDIFQVIISGFKDPFSVEALPCLASLVNISSFCRRFIDNKVVDLMFRGGLTTNLIEALKVLIKHVPSIRGYSQTRLKQSAAFILSKYGVNIDEKYKGASRSTRSVAPTTSTPKDSRGSIWQGGTGSLFGGNKQSNALPDLPVETPVIIDKSEEEVIFALEVLAMPEFLPKLRDRAVISGEEEEVSELLNITRDNVIRYMDDANSKIRHASANACAAILNIVIPGVELNSSDFYQSHQLLDRLLIVGVGDENYGIRNQVFLSISPSMDRILALSDNVYCLIEALNDEHLGVRAAAMTVLARVAHHDTLHIMPVVRLTLKRLIFTLNTSQDNHTKLDSVQILQSLVRGADTLIVPYVKQIIAPLMTLLNDNSADVVVVALSTIGDLALSSPASVRDHLDDLAPKLIDVLNDESSLVKQETAVVAMGKLVSSFAIVTEEPYKRYAGLFEGLVKAVQNVDDSSSELRLQAIKTLGLLGAVDFGVYQKHLIRSNAAIGAFTTAQRERKEDLEDDDESFDPISADGETKMSKIEKHCFTVVIRGLMSILKDSSLTFYHQTAITTAIRAIRILDPRADSQVEEVISGILFRLYQGDSGNNIKDALLDHLISLLHIMGRVLRKHTAQIVKVVIDFMGSHLQLCLDIIESLSATFSTPDFNAVLQEVLPVLMKVVEEEASSSQLLMAEEATAELEATLTTASTPQFMKNSSGISTGPKQPLLISNSDRLRRNSLAASAISKTSRILQKLVNMSEMLGEYRRDLIPAVISILDSSGLPVDVRREALCTLMHLSNDVDLPEFAGRLVHSLLRQLSSSDINMQNTVLNALSCLVCRLGTNFVPYIIPVRRKLKVLPTREGGGKLPRLEEYESLISRLLKQRPLPLEPADISDIMCKFDERVRNRASTSRFVRENTFQVNLQNLETAWALAGRNNSSDLLQWMGRLTIELIRQSPSQVIRTCATLAKTYRPLAEELFNSSFHSIWEELYASQVQEVVLDIPLINGIETALESNQIPKNIMISLLNLAEFMDMQDKALPIDVELLAKRAQDANMFAKCLRYREIQFASKNVPPSSNCIDALVTINNQLGLSDRAIGILRHLRLTYPSIEIQPRWLEKLCRWEDAFKAYDGEVQQCKALFSDSSPTQHERWLTCELGRLRCLHALGESEELELRARNLKNALKKEQEQGAEISNEHVAEIQKLGANAAWMLGEWDKMEEFLEGEVKLGSSKDVVLEQNVSFYHAILAIHSHEYDKAISLINDVRTTISGSIGALLSESYSRAYRAMVTMQILAEMEEVVEFKQSLERATFDNEKVRSNSIDYSSEDRFPMPNVDKLPLTGFVDLNAKKTALIYKWRNRLKWAPKDIDIYRQILAVHTLVADPTEDLDSWIELVTLCRKEGMYSLCSNILRKLGAPVQVKRTESQANLIEFAEPTQKTNDRVLFSTFQYWWSNGEKDRALSELTNYLSTCALPDSLSSKTVSYSSADATNFRVRCLLKKAEWMRILHEDDVHGVLSTLLEARELAKDQYSVWHAWAVANYDQLKKVSNAGDKSIGKSDEESSGSTVAFADSVFSSPPRPHSVHPNRNAATVSTVKLQSSAGAATLLNLVSVQQVDKASSYVIEGIKGFVRSIVLGQGQPVANLLQDTLRLITLLFSYGSKKGVFQLLETELDKVSPDNWLSVVPQLIARIHVKSSEISGLLRKLLIKVAATHPQALVCPISVALNTSDTRQKAVATDVLLEVRKKDRQLVEEATMVSRELMKVAITPHELWFDGLEQAAQFYMDSKDISAMLTVLKDLHDTMVEGSSTGGVGLGSFGDGKKIEGFTEGLGKIGYTTLRDISFRQNYAKVLQDAWYWIEQFRNTGRTVDLHQAWEIYQSVFKRIKGQISTLKQLELHHVSPALTSAQNLTLAVPGTYKPASPVIGINSFSPSVHVISSKQRPRRMALYGSDGKRYQYLLKGHEDLRQDERVMQLFGLINVCLNNDRITSHHGLSIVRYSVLPLSNNSGLIGWVENCDTLNQLIKQYREAKDIRLLVELKLLQSKCMQYDKLPLLHKVDLFQEVLDETTGEDLAKMLWLKSKTSDVWIERRANFTKSLAVMSMVGYILGLGDRHPSNLMLDRVSGEVVHIDFGDCFEITAQRAKYPEIVPFRLTRMLTNCMGVAGIEGTYRLTSERVMRVMRDNRYSVMAMLEAFVYDPLISWRLLAKHNNNVGAEPANISRVNSGEDVPAQRSPLEKMSSLLYESVLGGGEHPHPLSGDNLPSERSPRRSNAGSMRELLHRGSSHDISRTMSQDLMENDEPLQENLNSRALEVIKRIHAKLTGRDFVKEEDAEELTVAQQVDRLIIEATSIENLCQLFTGWCPLW